MKIIFHEKVRIVGTISLKQTYFYKRGKCYRNIFPSPSLLIYRVYQIFGIPCVSRIWKNLILHCLFIESIFAYYQKCISCPTHSKVT